VVGKPEIRAIIDRDRAADLGVQVADIATTLQMFVGGLKVSSYAESGEQYDVRLRADARYRASEDELSLLTVPSSKYGSVPLSSVVTTKAASGPAQIDRLGRRRQITIMANSAPGIGDNAVKAALDKVIADEHLPSGYTAAPIGFSKDTANTQKGF